jgi:hypothetical protein
MKWENGGRMRWTQFSRRLSRFSWGGLFSIVLLWGLFLLSFPASAQNSKPLVQPPLPISLSETTQMRLDLSTLIAQRNYWKDRSDSYEKSATALSAKLVSLEQSLQDSPDPSLMQAEIASLRTQLAEALSSSKESKATLVLLDQKIADLAGKVDKAGVQAKALEQQLVFWKITTAAGVLGTIAAVIWALVK